MSKPVVADNKPIKAVLVKGETYYFCACGKSKSQPFCDGSHAGTNIQPKCFVAKPSSVFVRHALALTGFCTVRHAAHFNHKVMLSRVPPLHNFSLFTGWAAREVLLLKLPQINTFQH